MFSLIPMQFLVYSLMSCNDYDKKTGVKMRKKEEDVVTVKVILRRRQNVDSNNTQVPAVFSLKKTCKIYAAVNSVNEYISFCSTFDDELTNCSKQLVYKLHSIDNYSKKSVSLVQLLGLRFLGCIRN